MAEKTEEAEKKSAILTRAFEIICPVCREKLSISVFEIRPPDWALNVLGVSDCNCPPYLVIMAPELENALMPILERVLIEHESNLGTFRASRLPM